MFFTLRNDYESAVYLIALESKQGFIGVIQGVCLDLGLEMDFGGQGEKISSISASHVGDAAYLALAPEQTVIVEFRHAVEVNRVNGYDSAFSKTR